MGAQSIAAPPVVTGTVMLEPMTPSSAGPTSLVVATAAAPANIVDHPRKISFVLQDDVMSVASSQGVIAGAVGPKHSGIFTDSADVNCNYEGLSDYHIFSFWRGYVKYDNFYTCPRQCVMKKYYLTHSTPLTKLSRLESGDRCVP
jgi:hypothetical protein